MIPSKLGLLSLIIIISSVCDPVHGNIRAVALHFRHGLRTPAQTRPNYGITEKSREIGLGQLTLNGTQQLYQMGAYLRPWYLSLFPRSGHFRIKNMQIISSPKERCVLSLLSFMAGFFPPPANDTTTPIQWQPVYFEQDQMNRILFLEPNGCPAVKREFDAANANFLRSNWLTKDKQILDKVEQFMGMPLERSLESVMNTTELIRSNKHFQYTPRWLLDVYEKTLKKYMLHYINLLFGSDLRRRAWGEPVLSQIVDNMVAVRDKTEKARNFLIYSGHDITLLSVIRLLGAEQQVPDLPGYGDTLALELHEPVTNEFEVQVVYMSSSEKERLRIHINVPGCGYPCTLSNFITVVHDHLVSDRSSLCRL